MSKKQTQQFVCLGPVLLFGLHAVVLFSLILYSFANVSRHFYCCFLAETLKLGGCAINSIKGTDKAHTYTQAQTLNRRPRNLKKAFWWSKKEMMHHKHPITRLLVFKIWINEKQNTLPLKTAQYKQTDPVVW